MAAKRSPVLGYNHNVRYRGVVLHVQTEDSGVQNPHVYTHLFHGGSIINSRKLVYDATAAEDIVKSLMQSQHKAMLKDLKTGNFDDRIDLMLADVPGLLPRGSKEAAVVEEETQTKAPLPPAAEPMAPPPGTSTQPKAATSDGGGSYSMSRKRDSQIRDVLVTAPRVGRVVDGAAPRPTGQAPAPTPSPAPTQAAPAAPGGRARTPTGGNIIMSRPAIIVGAPAVPEAQPKVRKAREEGFGQGLISEKSLDEVILAYLSEDK